MPSLPDHVQVTSMLTLSHAVVAVLVVVLLLAAGFFLLGRNRHPWTAILVAAIAAGVCFTVGGESAEDSPAPSVATVFAGVVGVLCVVAGVLALVPRRGDRPPSPAPSMLAGAAVAVAAVGLALNALFG